MTEREKIAQIIAEHLCPQGRAHKTLYGAERMCYSRNNFADCEKVSECVDALFEVGIGDVREAEHRADIAEQVLHDFAKLLGMGDTEKEEELFNNWLNGAKKKLSEKELAEEEVEHDELEAEIARLTVENAELRARLKRAIELPVKMGDWVYCVTDNRIIGGEVSEILIEEFDTSITFVRYDFDGEYIGDWCVSLENYNKTWFTTRVEAEGRLKELRGRER